MTYETSSQPVDCGSCTKPIPSGMPIYRVTSARLVRCSSCVTRMGLEYLKPAEANLVRQTADPPDFARLRRLAVPAKLQGRLIDWKAQQAGEREPGQEG